MPLVRYRGLEGDNRGQATGFLSPLPEQLSKLIERASSEAENGCPFGSNGRGGEEGRKTAHDLPHLGGGGIEVFFCVLNRNARKLPRGNLDRVDRLDSS